MQGKIKQSTQMRSRIACSLNDITLFKCGYRTIQELLLCKGLVTHLFILLGLLQVLRDNIGTAITKNSCHPY